MSSKKLEVIGFNDEYAKKLGITKQLLMSIANKINADKMHYLDKFKAFKCSRIEKDAKSGRVGRKQIGCLTLNQIGKHKGLRIEEIAESHIDKKFIVKL